MSDPLVSIVLPTYNGQRYLAESVESCRAQTYGNWELIIVDDASTDGTPAIIEEYQRKDGRIRSVRNETNRKLPASLNRGFAEARGEYLTWTSDDNMYRPRALEEMVRFLEERPGTALVYCDYGIIDECGALPGRVGTVPSPEWLSDRNCVGPCFLYRRALYDALGGYAEDLFLAEDYDYWLRAFCRFRLEALHCDLYLYRNHSESLTGLHKGRASMVARQALCRHVADLCRAHPPVGARACLRLAKHAIACHERAAARSYLLRALVAQPVVVWTPQYRRILVDALGGGCATALARRVSYAGRRAYRSMRRPG